MNASHRSLIKKIKALPDDRLSEVENFVEFVAAQERRSAAFRNLLAVAPALEAAGTPRLNDRQVQAEIRAYRAERKRRSSGAGRP